jgi:hypothetical protein
MIKEKVMQHKLPHIKFSQPSTLDGRDGSAILPESQVILLPRPSPERIRMRMSLEIRQNRNNKKTKENIERNCTYSKSLRCCKLQSKDGEESERRIRKYFMKPKCIQTSGERT